MASFPSNGLLSTVAAFARRARFRFDGRARRYALAEFGILCSGDENNEAALLDGARYVLSTVMGCGAVVALWNGQNRSFDRTGEWESVARVALQKFEMRSNGGFLAAPFGTPQMPRGALIGVQTAGQWTATQREFARQLTRILSGALVRRALERERQNSEQRYRAFVELSSEAIWRFELDAPISVALDADAIIEAFWERGFLAECNLAFARMYGFESPNQIVGARATDLMQKDDPANAAYLRSAISNDFRAVDVESVDRDRDGNERVFQNSLLGIVENGALLRIWGTQRDITEQKRAARAMEASEGRFRKLFDAAPTPILIARKGVFLYANRAALAQFGAQAEGELVGHGVAEFVAPQMRPAMETLLKARAAGLKAPKHYETLVVRRDGTTVPVEVKIAHLTLPDGEALLAFVSDLSEQKQTQSEIEALLERERLAARRANHLQELAGELGQAKTPADVARLTIERAVNAFDATAGVLATPDKTAPGTQLQIVAAQGYSDEVIARWPVIPLELPSPFAQAFCEQNPIWLETPQRIVTQYPNLEEETAHTDSQSLVALPLIVDGRAMGVLGFSFTHQRNFDAEDRGFLVTLAAQCAQALDRQRLDEQARDLSRLQRESLALLNTILNAAPVGFALFDRAGRYVLVNESLAKTNGLAAHEHLGKTVGEIMPTLGHDMGEVLERVWKTEAESGEIDVITRDEQSGLVRQCLTAFYPVRVEGGEMLGVGCFVLEITDRVRAEEERFGLFRSLDTQRARFQAILQQMPSAVLIAEAPSSRIILENAQVELILGDSFVEKAGAGQTQQWAFQQNGGPISQNEWPIARAIATGETIAGEEIHFKHQDGTPGILRVNAAPIRGNDGQIEAGVMIFDDVTQRARADAAQRFLAQAGALLLSTLGEHQIFEELADLCVPALADWCLILVSEGEGWRQIAVACADAQKTELARPLKTQLQTRENWPDVLKIALTNPRATLVELQTKSSSFLPQIGAISALVAPLQARGRSLGAMVWLSAESGRVFEQNDLSLAEELARRAALTVDNARLLEAAQSARDEAQTANRAKDEFLAVVSHELRTPLTPILGWLDLLRGPNLDESNRLQAYAVIERNALAQAQLVNDILDVSRITTGKLRLEFEDLALAPLVLRALDAPRMSASAKNLQLETRIEDVGFARADATRLQQVVWNLVTNAIKFTPEGGTIWVELERSGDEKTAILRVRDTGNGLAPEFLPHIFDRFRQADSSASRASGGLGLGLAIVRHIVESHGGTVRADSPGLGLGTTFSVKLPLVAQKFVPAAPAKTPVVAAPALKCKILVVDDEKDTRDALTMLLRDAGATVEDADSGASALELLRFFAPDVVISDIGMSVMDGHELRRQVRARFPNLPAIALTAYASIEDAARARDAGFERFLAKPVGARELVLCIGEVLAEKTT